MTKGMRKEQQRQLKKKEKGGCVSAILQIFDPQQLFIHHKRLPPPPPVAAAAAVFQSENSTSPATLQQLSDESREIRCHDDVSQQHHRSTSVIARLMGLESLPNSTLTSSSPVNSGYSKPSIFNNGENSFFDFFPEPIKQSGTEQKLRTRGGIDEASKDLETLKQILEALQLKGLLHSPPVQSRRNFVPDESPEAVMKLSTPSQVNRRTGNGYSPSSGGGGKNQTLRRCYEENRRSSLPLSVEAQKENRRLTLIHTLKPNHRRTNAPADSTLINHQSRRTKKPMVRDESPSVSESSSSSSITTSTDSNERSKNIEGYKDGRNLLQRCDKLLNSIAEMNAIDAMQPSPVSVLDYKDQSSPPFTTKHKLHFKAETDIVGELEDGLWSSIVLPIRSKCEEVPDDSDYVYITDVLRASHFFQEDCDMFSLLETQQFIKGNDTSKVSRLQRKLIFDTVNEILDRNRRLPPWKAVSLANEDTTKLSLDRVWLEFQRIRECVHGEDLFETICHVLKKDLERNGISGWGDRPVEMSDMILDIERLIFKDLISETIRDLAVLASRTTYSSFMPRRKLVF